MNYFVRVYEVAAGGNEATSDVPGSDFFRVLEPTSWVAIVEDLDVAKALEQEGGLAIRKALRQVLADHSVVCLRLKGRPLDRETYAKLVSVFGEIKLPEAKLIFKRR